MKYKVKAIMQAIEDRIEVHKNRMNYYNDTADLRNFFNGRLKESEDILKLMGDVL